MSTQTTFDDDNKYLPENPWISCAPILLAVFIYVMDGTIANVALPHMAGSFSATRDESIWILTSYLISSGIVIPSVDFFSKLFGRKNFYVISVFFVLLLHWKSTLYQSPYGAWPHSSFYRDVFLIPAVGFVRDSSCKPALVKQFF